MNRPKNQNTSKIDWSAVKKLYDAGSSKTTCMLIFHINPGSWQSAVKRGDIIPKPKNYWVTPLQDFLCYGSKIASKRLKNLLLRANLLSYQCAVCGIKEWLGKPIELQLDHINGDNKDNRLENLRILCPNCHCQTPTWGYTNRGNKQIRDEG